MEEGRKERKEEQWLQVKNRKCERERERAREREKEKDRERETQK